MGSICSMPGPWAALGPSVRVLRTGGEFAAAQLSKQRRRMVLSLVGGLAIGVASALFWHPGGAVVGLVAAMLAARPSYRRFLNYRNGAAGERSVAELLTRLPDDYVLLNDVVLPGHSGNIDHVLIGPCGVVVMETKRWAGTVACVNDRWSVGRYPRANVTRQVVGAAMAGKACLARAGAGAPGWVEAVVVFTHPHCRLILDRPTPRVVRFSQLMDYVAARSRPPRMRFQSVDALARALQNAASSV